MPICKNDSTKSYKGTELSPKGLGWCSHSEKINKKRKGKDGNEWVVKKTKNGHHKWVKWKIDCKNFRIYHKKIYKKRLFGSKIFEGNDILMGMKGDKKRTIYKFISYNKFEEKATKIPDGFKKRNNLSLSYINESYCGSKTIMKRVKMKKITHKGYKTYFTHDNGRRPYLVYINKLNVIVYKIPNDKLIPDNMYHEKDFKNKWMYTKLVFNKNVKKVYIGKNPKNIKSINHYLGQPYGVPQHQSADGNSILLQKNNNKYIFIGHYIYQFTMEDKVKKYISTLGNSDVPYPFIIGSKNIYFMLNESYVDKKYLSKDLTKENMTDLYQNYYGHLENHEKLSKYEIKMKNLKNIDY
jgi:hypothetical protein